MPIKISPILLTIRGYNNEVDINLPVSKLIKTPYDWVCTVQIFDDIAYISAFMGKMKLSDRRELAKQLSEKYEVKKVEWVRSNKEVVVEL